MKRKSNRRLRESSDQSNQIASDLTSAIAFTFIAACVILLLIINPDAETRVPEYEALQVTVTWDTCIDSDRSPGESKADVDAWILGEFQTPNGNEIRDILGYSTPDRKTPYFILDQDDKGYSRNPNAPQKAEELQNREVIKSNKQTLTDGYYHINLHMFADKGEFSKKDEVCVDVQVVVFKGSAANERIVCDLKASANTAAKLTENRQELSVCQFEVRRGKFVEGSQLDLIQNPFISSRKSALRRPPYAPYNGN